MKDLATVSKKELQDFLQGVNYIFCDVDGVLWYFHEQIPGSREALHSLKCLNKKIIFVSNNSTKTQDIYYNQLKDAGYELEKDDLVRPTNAIIHYLKKNKVSKDIYLVGMKPMQSELEAAGFKIERFHGENPEEEIGKYISSALKVGDNVGAVVVDLDINLTACQLQRAATYLKNPEVHFISGGPDKLLCFGTGIILIGPGAYQNVLTDFVGRKPHCMAKPSLEFNDFIKEKFGIVDSSKVLFIGDSVSEDMGFATNCGYKKLLVLSGLTQKESVDKWVFPDEYKPNYYASSLAVLNELLQTCKHETVN